MTNLNTDNELPQSQLEVDGVNVDYGQTRAVNKVSLKLKQGEIGCLLGPSGCGKTSLLRAIAGFENISEGHIRLAQHEVSSKTFQLPPEKRKVGMVFQDFALFPHLNIEKNIGFGLKHLAVNEREERIKELLALVSLQPYAESFPHELSGGQQQRVALARAIAPRPDILLLDEPFSNLDIELRIQLAEEVRKVLKENTMTAIMVTHDQNEAFAIADTIGVMQQGNLLQWNSAYDLYHTPTNRFVANFVGEGNMIKAQGNKNGQLESVLGILDGTCPWPSQQYYDVLIRPDDLIYDETSPMQLRIVNKRFRGSEFYYELELPDAQTVTCSVPSHIHLEIGTHIGVRLELRHVVAFPIK